MKAVLLSVPIFIGALVSLGTAIFNWDWAMKTDEAKPVVKLAGRRNARIVYAVLGTFLLVTGVLVVAGVLSIPQSALH